MSFTLVPPTNSFYGHEGNSPMQARQKAAMLYTKVNGGSILNAFIQKLIGKENQLKDLSHVSATAKRRPTKQSTVINIPVKKIVGSEGRTKDFDSKFNPISDHLEDRWIGVAAAHPEGIPLPPVQLIQVGDEYYIRDGHHRVSVANAIGQTSIEAQILYALELAGKVK
jgi:hypothetical protein